jgi:hypothetical protein
MINCERTENGGRISVMDENAEAVVTFTVSDSTSHPLTLRIVEESPSDARLLLALANSLIERYESPVVWLRTGNAELRYSPWIGSVYRHSTAKEESLYTLPFNAGKPFSRMWSLAEAMSEYSFVRSLQEDLQFFNRYAILAQLRKHMKPLEFLSVKEECDYSVQCSCVNTTRSIIERARENIAATGLYREAFDQVLSRIENEQKNGSVSFDNKISYLHEAMVNVCLPSIVLFGSGNKFSKAITEAFTSGAAEYISTSQTLLETYEECLNHLNEGK